MTNDEMTPPQKGLARFIPQLTSRWWTVLFGMSLMANLLIGGLALGHRFGEGNPRLAGITAVQMIPREFFSDLPKERRREILKLIRENSKDLRQLRDGTAEQVLSLAAVLEKDVFNLDEVNAAVQSISTGTGSLAARGSAIVMEIVSRLTPEERKALASAIRDRAASESRRRRRN